MYKQIFYLCTLLHIFSISSGQTNTIQQKIDEFLRKRFPQSAPGCQVLVAERGKIIYKNSFGRANLELNVSLSPDMVFNIASITKQFTAVAILQLAEQGKISLEDSLQKFVPDFPSKGYRITIENLLTHTSGIKDYLQIDYRYPFMERWDFTPKQLIDSFKIFPLDFEPDTKFSYSNSGYYLLGYIIEKVSGRSYQSYIHDNLLKPLNLTHTHFDSTGAVIPGRVNGYRQSGAMFKNAEYWSPTIEYSAGGLISNVEDLFRWHEGLYACRILKKESLEKALTPYRLKNETAIDYGYGWFLKTVNGVRSIEHAGGIPGFVSNEIYFPARDLFIAILSNCGTTPMDDLSVNISGIALGRPLQSDIKVDPKILNKYIGVYKLSIDSSKTITILKENSGLVAKVSDSDAIPLLFQSETKFQFKNLLDANCEFVIENGKVTKFNVSQQGHYEWIKAG